MSIPRILYLTWGSTPRTNSVFGSQVIEQLTANALALPGANFSLVSAVPLLNAGIYKRGFSFFSELQTVSTRLSPIPFRTIPIYAPQTYFNSTRFSFSTMHFGAHSHLRRLLFEKRPDIVHCRSYHATWAALEARRHLSASFRIIFDARGLWPEEVSLKHGRRDNASNRSFRKTIEKRLLTESDLTVAVSQPMLDHFLAIGANRCALIPLSVCLDDTDFETTPSFSPPHFIYVGTLSKDTWHRPETLAAVYRHLRTLFQQTRLTIVTTSPRRPLLNAFRDVPAAEVSLTETHTRKRLFELLTEATAGLLPYFSPQTQLDHTLAKTVFAIKTAEYLCAGLPVIANKACTAAAEHVVRNDAGIAYGEDFRELTHSTVTSLFDPSRRNEIRRNAIQHFSSRVNAERYAAVYRSLL